MLGALNVLKNKCPVVFGWKLIYKDMAHAPVILPIENYLERRRNQFKKIIKDESDFGHTPSASQMYRRQLTSLMPGSCQLIPLREALSFC